MIQLNRMFPDVPKNLETLRPIQKRRQVYPDLTSWNSCIAACDWKIGTQLLADMQDLKGQVGKWSIPQGLKR